MYCKNCGASIDDRCAFCPNCGTPTGANQASHCPHCGLEVDPNAMFCGACGTPLGTAQTQATPAASWVGRREIVTAIILSIVTCGIYGIIWFVSLTNEINALTGKTNDTSGGMCFLLGLVTCGIYTYYWAYKLGEKCDQLKGSNDSRILFLILMFFCPIVTYALAQDTINKTVGN